MIGSAEACPRGDSDVCKRRGERSVPTTLLAVDDSVTMRKVLEMTFAGEDFRVVTADSAEAALGKLRAERPSIVLCDVTLDGVGGYGLCAKIKAESPGVAVVVLASKQQP